MSRNRALVLLLFFVNFKLIVSQEAETVIKIGILVDNGMDEQHLRQAVDRLTRLYCPWLRRSRIITVWAVLNTSQPTYVSKTVCQFLDTGIHALVTALRCGQLKSLPVMVDQLSIPHVPINLGRCRNHVSGKFTNHLTSHNQHIHKVLSEIVLFLGWKRIALVFDETVENRQKQDLVIELSKNRIESMLYTLSPISPSSRRHKNLALLTTSANLAKLMGLASDLNMLGPDYWWIIIVNDVTVKGTNGVFSHSKSGNILFVKAKPRNIADTFQFYGISCIRPDKSLPLAELGVANMTVMNRTGITSGNCLQSPFQSVHGSRQLIEQLRHVCDSTEEQSGSPCIPTEYDLYSTQDNSDALVHVGQWTVRNKLTTRENRLYLNNFSDFRKTTIRIGLNAGTKPNSYWDEDQKSYEGIMIDIVKELARILKFNYTFLDVPDGLYGHRLPNGSWTGLIGMVERREVELAAESITVTPERSEVVDFTTPILQDSLGILTPKPKEVADLLQIFKPFSISVWLSLIAFLFTAAIMLIVISTKTRPLTGEEKTTHHIKENVFLIISSSFEQGPTFYPKSISARCFLTFWLVFTLWIMTMYTANLAAVLTVSTPLKPVNSLQDLIDRRNMKVLFFYGTNAWSVFKESDNPVFHEVSKKMEKFKQSIDQVKTGGYSFIADRSYLSYVAMTNCREVRLADERFLSSSVAFAVPKNSSYKQAMDLSIQKMVESGVMLKITRKWWTPSGNCSGQPTIAKALVLNLDRVGGIFMIYIAVCVVAGLCLLAEHILFKFFSRNASQTVKDIEAQ